MLSNVPILIPGICENGKGTVQLWFSQAPRDTGDLLLPEQAC